MPENVELEADEVAVYMDQADGSLTSLSEKYPLVDPHLYAPLTVLVDMKISRDRLAAGLKALSWAVEHHPGFFVDEPRPEPFHLE